MTRDIKFRHYFPSTGVVTAGHDVMTIILTSTGKEDFWKDAVWMQFTGLKDRNGKEIYEGDIVRLSDEDDSEHEITVVRYLDGGFVIEWDNHFNGGDSDLTTVGWAGYDGCKIEVIGNFYENPGLLKP